MHQEFQFQNYIIRHTENKSIAFHKTFKDRFQKFVGLDAVSQAKDWVRNFCEKSRTSWKNVNQCCISFNSTFIYDIMGEEDFFSFDMIKEADDIFFKVYCDYNKGQFKTYGKSTRKKPCVGAEWHGSPNLIEQNRFLPNARYSLEEIENNTFKLIFDSIIEDKSQRYSLGIPGIMFYSMRK